MHSTTIPLDMLGSPPRSTNPQSTLWSAKETDMAENKTKPTSASVDDFIAAIENPRRRADALVSLTIYKEVTKVPGIGPKSADKILAARRETRLRDITQLKALGVTVSWAAMDGRRQCS
jgi:predicted DNA-binding helix-hairpin-helix protein